MRIVNDFRAYLLRMTFGQVMSGSHARLSGAGRKSCADLFAL